MRHTLILSQEIGPELRTRQVLENFAKTLNKDDLYLIDMTGVEQISRSAADELYNITHGDYNVEVVGLTPFVNKMLDAVKIGRFHPRVRIDANIKVIKLTSLEDLHAHLEKI